MTNSIRIPERKEITHNHTWDLASLFKDKATFEQELASTKEAISHFTHYQENIKPVKSNHTKDMDILLSALDDYYSLSRQIDKLIKYAYLSYSCDGTSTIAQEFMGHATYLKGEASSKTAFFSQEMSEIAIDVLHTCCKDQRFADYHVYLKEIIRSRPHILSLEGEQILAQQQAYDNSFNDTFDALLDIDIHFGDIETPEGKVALTQASLGVLLEHPKRDVRQKAYESFFSTIDTYRHTLAKLYSSHVLKDKAEKDIRHYDSTLGRTLFSYNIDVQFYTQLLDVVSSALPSLHRWYATLADVSKLNDFSVYDTRAPFFFAPESYSLSYESAVEVLVAALVPLGQEYCTIARKALLDNRWVDRYENKGKQSGAFSMPMYGEKQFIMLNYRDDSFDHLFTLAHELGHSMHSYFSAQNNPYPTFQYTIFEAEVASTVNEMLLYDYLLTHPEALSLSDAETKKLDVYLQWQHIQDFCGTFFRQIMFSEFEYQSHKAAQEAIPLTVDFFCSLSQDLQKKYYGDRVALPDCSRILGLRIPHFYRSFYVYQYATGIASAIDISTRILEARSSSSLPQDKDNSLPHDVSLRDSYLGYLKNGGKNYPLDSLKKTGVDFTDYKTIHNALAFFDKKVSQFTASLL